MILRKKQLAWILPLLGASSITLATDSSIKNPTNAAQWLEQGQEQVARNGVIAREALRNSRARAKNVILFVGDGMGVSTVTAARILAGQLNGETGEENRLFFETFPNLALSKTYNTNQQTPDSAGTMTAMMSGLKTKAGIIGVNQEVVRGDCASVPGNEVVTALELAEIVGMSTGVVSTARITHATPAATYAHSMDRNFEDNRDASKFSNAGSCKDIASQLIDFPQRFSAFPQVDGLEVAMGGGRRSFLKREDGADPEDGGKGERTDGRDLTAEWTQKYSSAKYVWDKSGFDEVNTETTDHLLGLFEMSHMEYEFDRKDDKGGEPSLSEMTKTAIDVLDNNPEGFFLHVESGRIDHGHHATNPMRALTDAIEFANAVKVAYESTDPEDTLIIVTADHSHVFTLAGYPTRGNPILGKVVGNDSAGEKKDELSLASDGLPYTTVGYTNGRGFNFLETGGDTIYGLPVNMEGRVDLSDVDTEDQGFHPETLVPRSSETHAAEDVAIYASGPGSNLINGLLEQNAIYHVMNSAARLEKRANSKGWSR
ncbi:alkaline phosphatase [Pseudoteredinibacter isoporae]|uniref:Alkaline phosphatase n=1 Tax=Pseudoteredinibacter isoporae TaxID=570281 RepID=A0A7X0JTM1_9GAMM|nr:alkaline phosphatase [Pseudoteredinibacter isoporae]MBB6521230.1 alkaline phosphatase [Pseudoteredinibacter isoporae]